MQDKYNYTLAEVLKAARLEKQMSITDVELQTKIRASYLIALENSDYEKLPADIYVRGILRNYSHFLDLKYTELLRLYRKEGNFLGINPVDKKYYLNIKSFFSKLVFSHKLIVSLIMTILAILIAYYLYLNYDKMTSPPELSINLTEERLQVETPEILLEGKTNLNSTLLINGPKVPINNDGIFQEIFNLNPGNNLIIIQSVSNRNNKSQLIQRTVFFEDTQRIESLGQGIEIESNNEDPNSITSEQQL